MKNNKNEWTLLKATDQVPMEISNFIDSIFQVLEIRKKVCKVNGIVFEVHTNEKNHTLPHVHAEYGEFNISILIDTAEVLSGNLPKKQEKIAVQWVKEHKALLLDEWSTYSISAVSSTTESLLRWE